MAKQRMDADLFPPCQWTGEERFAAIESCQPFYKQTASLGSRQAHHRPDQTGWQCEIEKRKESSLHGRGDVCSGGRGTFT
ncbi:hypothetical protein KTAU_00220 [Thermogemmatispora aurantia]|uniref:Uncharacterized protein n=1 Tax=Thermogemmatispora aurantia TaxID=2045279 RepID=A0A5J4K094_9CHLR|nr:hypothetical protein KTAU_00220 [Thermogemmatispora aurantia]